MGTVSGCTPAPHRSSWWASVAPCAATVSSAIRRSQSSVRFADFDAFAVIFVPSRVIVASAPIPSRAHRIRTWANNSTTAASKSARNRAIAVWSGRFPPQITRNATSWPHNRSIRRELRTPCAYDQINNVNSMSGS